MSRNITYPIQRLPALKERLAATSEKFKMLGYGSRSRAARWLLEQKKEPGTMEQIAKKIANLLGGYVRGIHPTMRNGGVWRPEEAERILDLLDVWLKQEALNFLQSGSLKLPRQDQPVIEPPKDEF